MIKDVNVSLVSLCTYTKNNGKSSKVNLAKILILFSTLYQEITFPKDKCKAHVRCEKKIELTCNIIELCMKRLP